VWVAAFTNPCVFAVATNGRWIHFLANASLVHLTKSRVRIISLEHSSSLSLLLLLCYLLSVYNWQDECCIGKSLQHWDCYAAFFLFAAKPACRRGNFTYNAGSEFGSSVYNCFVYFLVGKFLIELLHFACWLYIIQWMQLSAH